MVRMFYHTPAHIRLIGCLRDVTTALEDRTAAGAATSAAVPSANDLEDAMDTAEDSTVNS